MTRPLWGLICVFLLHCYDCFLFLLLSFLLLFPRHATYDHTKGEGRKFLSRNVTLIPLRSIFVAEGEMRALRHIH